MKGAVFYAPEDVRLEEVPEPTAGQFYPCKPEIFAQSYEAVE